MNAEHWRHRIRAATHAFFLDVDGTLLGFKDRPQDVVADEALRSLLQRLQHAACGALALVSGRTISDLDRIMAPLVFPAAGTHGADIRYADGQREIASQAELDALRPTLTAFVDARPGLMLEDKGAAIALHYRHAPARGDDVFAFLAGAIADEALMVQHGKMVAEIKSSATSKGHAITRLMASAPFAGRTPVFIGDDLTDEHGFAAINSMAGISIKVGIGMETAAQHLLADTQDVRDLLAAACTVSE